MGSKRKSQRKKNALQLATDGQSLNRTDLGTPEGRVHGMAEIFYSKDEGTGQTVKRARMQVQVRHDYMLAIKRISHAEHEACERLYRDLDIGRLQARVTVSLAAVGGGGGVYELSDVAVAARQRVRHALGSLSAEQCEIVIWLIWWGRAADWIGRVRTGCAETAARAQGYELIHDALAALMKHYGIDDHA